MTIDGGYSTCLKCDREMREGGDTCKYCGTNQIQYREELMIKNLNQFGFEPTHIYKKQNWIQRIFCNPVIIETIYNYQLFSVRKNGSDESNRTLFFNGKKINTLNEYGDFNWVSREWKKKMDPYMDENNREMIKIDRDKKLNQLI